MSKNILIIGNCQVLGLRDLVAAAFPEFVVEAHEIWNKTAEELRSIANEMHRCDMLVTQPFYALKYEVLTRSVIERDNSAKRTLSIHNLYWNAATPDCRYVLAPAPIKSPVMNYHSGKVLDSFLSGDTVEVAVEKFGLYNKKEAVKHWNSNIEAFQKREQNIDVKFLDELLENVMQHSCFHVFNHPSISLLKKYAEKIVGQLQPGVFVPDRHYDDRLERLGSFPPYSSICEHLLLPYKSSKFMVKTPSGLVPMDIAEFVSCSYEIYRKFKIETLI